MGSDHIPPGDNTPKKKHPGVAILEGLLKSLQEANLTSLTGAVVYVESDGTYCQHGATDCNICTVKQFEVIGTLTIEEILFEIEVTNIYNKQLDDKTDRLLDYRYTKETNKTFH